MNEYLARKRRERKPITNASPFPVTETIAQITVDHATTYERFLTAMWRQLEERDKALGCAQAPEWYAARLARDLASTEIPKPERETNKKRQCPT